MYCNGLCWSRALLDLRLYFIGLEAVLRLFADHFFSTPSCPFVVCKQQSKPAHSCGDFLMRFNWYDWLTGRTALRRRSAEPSRAQPSRAKQSSNQVTCLIVKQDVTVHHQKVHPSSRLISDIARHDKFFFFCYRDHCDEMIGRRGVPAGRLTMFAFALPSSPITLALWHCGIVALWPKLFAITVYSNEVKQNH